MAQQLANEDPRNPQTAKLLDDTRAVLARSHAPPE
jgi:hypothetical protein